MCVTAKFAKEKTRSEGPVILRYSTLVDGWRSPAEVLAALSLSRVAWVGRSDVCIVRDDENVVAWVLHLVLHDRALETFWHWWQLIVMKVSGVMLLTHVLLRSSLNLLASDVRLLIDDVRCES